MSLEKLIRVEEVIEFLLGVEASVIKGRRHVESLGDFVFGPWVLQEQLVHSLPHAVDVVAVDRLCLFGLDLPLRHLFFGWLFFDRFRLVHRSDHGFELSFPKKRPAR